MCSVFIVLGIASVVLHICIYAYAVYTSGNHPPHPLSPYDRHHLFTIICSSSPLTSLSSSLCCLSPPSMSSPAPQQDSSSTAQDPAQSTLQQLFGTLCKQKLLEEVDRLKEAVQKDDPQQVIMAVPMLLALTICPAMLGTQEAIRQSQSKTKREEHRGRRCNLVVSCVKPSIRARDVNNKLVVLKDSKVRIACPDPPHHHHPLTLSRLTSYTSPMSTHCTTTTARTMSARDTPSLATSSPTPTVHMKASSAQSAMTPLFSTGSTSTGTHTK